MSIVKNGHYVQVHYTGTLEDGTVFDTSEGRTPLEFQVGSGNIIPGFENALLGMELNDEKKISLTVDQAYGPVRDDLQREFPNSVLGGEAVQVGQPLMFNSPGGPVRGKVIHVSPENFIVDFNHPLAGKNLEFFIKLVGISDHPTQAASCSCCGPAGSEGSGCDQC